MPSTDDATARHHIDQRVFAGRGSWLPLPHGSINDAWRVTGYGGNDVIVRIGPTKDVAERGPSWLRVGGLAIEQYLLAVVRPHIAQVPATIAAGFAPGRRSWVVQEYLAGLPLSLALPELPIDERRHVWREVGAFLRRLRQVIVPWFGTPDGKDAIVDWPGMVASDTAGLFGDARRMGLPLAPFETLNERVQRCARQLAVVRRPGIVHSDLDPRHIFVDRGEEGWMITGVIDWEYGRYGDPESEGLLIDMLDRPEDDPDRLAFLAGYGAFDDRRFARIRRTIYRGIGLGWELTDAVRCDDGERRETTLAAFRHWADQPLG